MDKKLLVSLMAFAPVAAFAQSDWAVADGNLVRNFLPTGDNWIPEGTVNLKDWTTNAVVKDKVLYATVGSKYMESTALTLPQGYYTFKFGKLVNAHIELTYGDTTVDMREFDSEGEFVRNLSEWSLIDEETGEQLPISGALVIKVVQDKLGYDFGIGYDEESEVNGVVMTLNYDMDTAVSKIVAGLSAIPSLEPLPDKGPEKEIAKLKTERESLANKLNDAKEGSVAANVGNLEANWKIATEEVIDPKTTSAQAAYNLFNIYNLNNFFAYKPAEDTDLEKGTNLLPLGVSTLNKDVEAYNDKVGNFNANVVRKGELESSYNTLKNELTTQLGTNQKDLTGTCELYDKYFAESGKTYTYKQLYDADKVLQAFCDWYLTDAKTQIQNQLEAFKSAIATAYADANLTKSIGPNEDDEVEFKFDTDDLSQLIANIDYKGAIDDWFAYKYFGEKADQVKIARGQAFANINDDLYKSYKDPREPKTQLVYLNVLKEYDEDLDEIYNNNEDYPINLEGGLVNKNQNIIGASVNLGDAIDDADDRIARMKHLWEPGTEDDPNIDAIGYKVKALEAQYTIAKAELNKDNNNLTAMQGGVNDPMFATAAEADPDGAKDVTDALAEYEKAVKRLDNLVYDTYMNNTIDTTSDDYKNAVQAVENAKDEYDTAIAALGNGSLKLLNELEQAYAAIKTDASAPAATDKPSVSQYNLPDKLKPSYNTIKENIEALLGMDPEENNIKTVQDANDIAIMQLTKSGETLVGTFRNAQNYLDKAQAALNAYNAAANSKKYLPGVSDNLKNIYMLGCSVDGKDVALTPAEIQAKFDAYAQNLVDYASNGEDYTGEYATPLVAMKAVNKLAEALEDSEWVDHINASKGSYAKYVTDQNYNAVKAYAEGIDKQIAEAEAVVDAAGKHIPGWPDKFTGALEFPKNYKGATTLEKAATDITTAARKSKVDDKVAALGTCDSDLEALYNAYTGKYDKVKAAIENWQAYTALNKDLDNAQAAIDKFIKDVINATSPDAYATYIGKNVDGKGGVCKGFNDELARIQGLVDGSYSKVTEVADKASYDALIMTLNEDIAKALIDCENNEAAFQALIALDAQVNAAANELAETIKAEDGLASNVQEYLNKIKTEITDKAVEYNKEVRDYFAKGQTVANQNDYTKKYNDLLTELSNIKSEWSGGYSAAVDEANKALLVAEGFDTDLASQYQEAVNWVNVYRQNITVGNGFYDMLNDNDPDNINAAKYKANHEALKDMYVDVLDFTKRYQALMTYMTDGKPSEYVILENIVGMDPKDKSLTERQRKALVEYNELCDILNGYVNEDGEYVPGLPKQIEDAVNGVDNAGVAVAKQYFQDVRNDIAWTQNLMGIINWLEDLGFSKDEVVDGKTVYGEASQACMTERRTLNSTWTAYYEYLDAISEAQDEFDAAETAKNDAWNTLQSADEFDKEAAQEAYDKALADFNEADDALAAAKQALILGMNNIAKQVDPIAAIDVEQFVTNAVQNQWENTYNKYTADVESWIKEIGSNDAYEYNKNELQDLLDRMVELNNNWNKLSNWEKTYRWFNPPYFDVYYNTEVEREPNVYWGTIVNTPGLVPLYKAAYETYYEHGGYGQLIVSEKVYAQLVGNVNSGLNHAQAALNEKVEEFGYNQLVQNYQDMIDNLTDDIQGSYNGLKESDLNADKFDLATANYNSLSYMQKYIYLTQLIEGSSVKMFAALQQYVGNDLVKAANSALNNAKVAGNVTDAEFPEKAKEINDIQSEVWALEYVEVEDDIAVQSEDAEEVNAAEENAKNLAALKDYEAKLCELIATYDKGTSFSSVADAKALLDPMFKDLGEQLNDFIEKIKSEGAATAPYGQDVIDEFLPQAEDLLDAFNSVKAAYEKSGDDLIADADDYKYDLDRIQYNFDHSNWNESDVSGGLYDQWERAQNKASKYLASDKIAEGILDTLNTLEVAATTAHNEAERYYHKDPRLSDYLNILVTINGQEEDKSTGAQYIKSLREIVDEYKAQHSYTEDYNPTGWRIDNLTSDVNTYVRYDLKDAFNAACNSANQDIQKLINDLLNNAGNENYWKYSYQNWEEIYEALDGEQAKVTALQNTFPNPIVYIPSEDGSHVSGWVIDDKGNEVWTTTDLLYATTNAEEAFEAYQDLQNKLSAIDAKVNDLKNEAEAGKYIKGDLDKDGDITIMDVQALIKLVGEGVDFEDDQDMKNRADVNSDDAINVADVTALINKMMNPGRPGRPAIVAPYNVEGANNSFVVEEIEGVNGLRRFAVVVSNEVAFAAGQIDIKLNGNGNIAAVTLGDRAEELEAFVFENSDNTRVVMTSLENALISGNNGSVIYIDVEGNGEISVDNVIFSDLNGKAYNLSNSGSGIDGIYDSIKNGVKAIYNAAGQKLRNMTKGVNIVRNADGTTTKKVGK